MKKIMTNMIAVIAMVALIVALAPMASSPALPLKSDSPVIVSTLGTTVSGLGMPNNESRNTEEIEHSELGDIEKIELEDIEEIEPEEPIGIDKLLANAFNCSKDIIFTADSSYSLIKEEFLMDFLERNTKNEEPRLPEIHDCDDFSMEFLMEIKAECALHKIVPGVGVVWIKDYDAEDEDEGHAVNFWIDPADKSVWTFDPQTDEEYSIAGQLVIFVYM